jgi:hypothetical protein
MYRQAVEWLEDAGKDALAGDVFRWVLGLGRVFRRMGLAGKLACWRSHGADAAAGAPVPTQIAPLLPPPLTHCSAGSHPLQAGHRSACPHSEVERCCGHAAALCRLLRRLWGPQLRVQGLPWGSGGVAACGEGKGCLADLPGGRCAVLGLAWLGRLGRLCVLPACLSRTGIRAAQAGTNRGSRCRCRRTPWGSTTSAAATRRLRQMRCVMHIAGKRRQLGLVGR